MTVLELDKKLSTQRHLAGKLDAYAGKWVAVRGDEVVAAARTTQQLMQLLGDDPESVDRIFRVPARRARLLL